MKQGKTKQITALILALPITAPAVSQTETIRIEVPLMGKGELAVLKAGDERVALANIKTATERGGFVYFDQHVRHSDERLAGSPPQREIIARKRLNCNEMNAAILTVTTRNFHTLNNAPETLALDDNQSPTPIQRNGADYSICSSINGGDDLYTALVKNHYYELEKFPVFALSYWDSVDIEEMNDEGEITRISESALLQYLRDNNPNF